MDTDERGIHQAERERAYEFGLPAITPEHADYLRKKFLYGANE